MLIKRRAKFVYEGARLAAIAAKAPIIPRPWDERESLFQAQFLKVIKNQCGEKRKTSVQELHNDWVIAYKKMGWVYGDVYDPKKKMHPDMVSYIDLGQLEREKDDIFIALCEIARKWIY